MNNITFIIISLFILILIYIKNIYFVDLNTSNILEKYDNFNYISSIDPSNNINLLDDFLSSNVNFQILNHKQIDYFSNLSTNYIWTYWENTNGRTEPYAHIKLCLRTMHKHLSKYNLIILDPYTIKSYLPNINAHMDNLLIAQKVDYYRVALLQKYGGIWVDADTIIMRDFDDIFNKLANGYDFIGFGCTGLVCYNGYPNPSNGVIASIKNGKLITCCLEKLDKIINSNTKKKFNYFDLGKKIIWKCLKIYLKTNYKKEFYHYASEYDGSRDINGKWIHTPNHFSIYNTELLNPNKVFFIFLANYEICNKNENKWILNLSEDDILNGPWWISSLFSKSLNVNLA